MSILRKSFFWRFVRNLVSIIIFFFFSVKFKYSPFLLATVDASHRQFPILVFYRSSKSVVPGQLYCSENGFGAELLWCYFSWSPTSANDSIKRVCKTYHTNFALHLNFASFRRLPVPVCGNLIPFPNNRFGVPSQVLLPCPSGPRGLPVYLMSRPVTPRPAFPYPFFPRLFQVYFFMTSLNVASLLCCSFCEEIVVKTLDLPNFGR